MTPVPGHPARHATRVLVAAAIACLLAPLARAQEQDYLNELAAELAIAQVHLDDASAAISACNDNLIACFQQPAPFADRIDQANVGLEGVRTNLSALLVPPPYASSHALLLDGFRQLIDGLALYATGLRERDVDKINSAADLISAGKRDIETASAAILSQPPGTSGLLLVLTAAVVAMGVSVGVLAVFLLRRALPARREYIEKTWATCPKCGEVLDMWWTYRRRQIRDWRESHLRSHARDRPPGGERSA
ncbi:MAG: hypothetical protein ACT4OI_00965 [Methanobacteriota archaeon]